MGSTTVLAAGSAGVIAVGAALSLSSAGVNNSTPANQTTGVVEVAPITDQDAARLAKQATFGPTPAVIARIKQLGINGWLDEQFSTPSSSFADLQQLSVRNSFCDTEQPGNANCFRIYRDTLLPAMRFYQNAVQGDDQLRQRVALALFNIMPVSGLKIPDTAGQARYQQMLLDNAFGNYADVLKAVILNGTMAVYLDQGNSTATSPNENLGRELMQLFTIGPDALGADGTQRHDSTGATVPNYTSRDVSEIARALTGWTYARFAGTKPKDTGVNDLTKPLVPDLTAFDAGAKTFLGVTVPAGASPEANVNAIVNRLMSDPSISARISKLLIQALVRSNPSPAYIGRVSSLFRNNRSGKIGDLRAVVRAILTDPEARAPDLTQFGGKLKDPILLETALARAVGVKTDGYAFTVRDVQMGQQYLRGPSIFGDYPPDFPMTVGKTVMSPASKLMTVGNIIERTNFVWQWTMSGDQARAEYATPAWVPARQPTVQDWSAWETFGDDVDGMIDRIDLLLLAKSMTNEQRTALRNAMLLVTDPGGTAMQARRRAQAGLYIVASSLQFQIDR